MGGVFGTLIAVSSEGSRDWLNRWADGIYLGLLPCECLLGGSH
jgi:hypothetical protein